MAGDRDDGGTTDAGTGRVAPKGRPTGGDDRERRRARQLRANLRRRKGQQRARTDGQPGEGGDG